MTTHAFGDRDLGDAPQLSSPTRKRRKPALTTPRRWYPWVYGFVLAWWAASWNLRLSVLMAWMPVEPVILASVAMAICVAHRLGQRVAVPPKVAAPLLVLVLGFLPGALNSGDEGYAPDKVATLALVVLPVVLASVLLLDSSAARQGWVAAQLAFGVAVTIAAAITGHEAMAATGRFSLLTVDTISTSRFIGAAVVVLLLVATTSWRRAWWALPAAAGCGAVLIHVGSRGPLLFALAAAVVVVAIARSFAGRRVRLLGLAASAAVAVYGYALSDGGAGGRRVIDSLRDGLADGIRAQLLHDAVRAGLAHPFGIGWGEFLNYSPEARSIANDQGVSYAHNAFAEAFSEGGFLALLSFATFVLLGLVRLWRASLRPADAVLLGTVLYWLLNAMVSSDLVGNRFMWISLACALAVRTSSQLAIPAGSHVPIYGSAVATRNKAV